MPTDKPRQFDAHCHVFNHDVLKVRLIAALLTLLTELEESSGPISRVIKIRERRANIRSILEKIQVFLRVLFSTSESVFRLLKKKYQNLSPDNNFCFTPLMFDSEFCITIDKETGKDPLDEMIETLDKKLHDLRGRHVKFFPNKFFHPFDMQLTFLSSMVIPKLREIQTLKAKGYKEQLDAIIDLKKEFPQIVYPFLGVDPRREGIYEMVKIYFESVENPFTGIKLYAPNGFSPMDPRLMYIYEYCQSKNIPITAHCSYGGFATLDNELEVHGYFYDGEPKRIDGIIQLKVPAFKSGWVEDRAYTINHPKLWDMVMQNYPSLKLNLAHFGVRAKAQSEEKMFEWTGYIIDMMRKYKNLYTDLSCFTSKYELELVKNKFLDQKLSDTESVVERVMYGSDFFLNLFFIDTIESYYKNFFSENVFTRDELNKFCINNPKKFLFKE